MGFIQVFKGSLSGSFREQWSDFYGVPDYVTVTSAAFPAVPVSTGYNDKRTGFNGTPGVISNGSRIVVPEGFALVTLQDGRVTGFVAEAGGYEWQSSSPQSSSVFAGQFGDALVATWDRFRFRGVPASAQTALLVSLRELPDNRFGTQAPIMWHDKYLNAQVGALVRGSYTIRITDPILFVKTTVPPALITGTQPVFDLTFLDDPVGNQLFSEVVSSLSAAFSRFANDDNPDHTIQSLQSRTNDFGRVLSQVVEEGFFWSERGLAVGRVSVAAIEYDEDSRRLLSDVRKADALEGSRGESFLRQSVARGFEGAGENGGAGGLFGVGMASSFAGGMLNGGFNTSKAENKNNFGTAAERVLKAKELLDAGAITEEEFEALKERELGV